MKMDSLLIIAMRNSDSCMAIIASHLWLTTNHMTLQLVVWKGCAMKISHFKVGEQGLNRFFGPLEAKIMDVLWSQGPLSIKEVQMKLGENKVMNFNTVMTVMNRLVDKGVLLKEMQGRTSIYAPVETREEFMNTQSKELTQELMDQFGSIAVAHMLDAVEEADPELISQLEQKIEQWKKERQ